MNNIFTRLSKKKENPSGILFSRMVFFLMLLFSCCFFLNCIEEEVWKGCDGERYEGDSEVNDAKEDYRSPYWSRLEPICLGAPPKIAIRTKGAIRFNWRKEVEFRYTKVVITNQSYDDYSHFHPEFDISTIVAVWNESFSGVPGFLSLDSFQAARNGLPQKDPYNFEFDVNYYWAVWAFDRLGRLSHASEEREFILKDISGFGN
jgi:hypothetical protein